MAYPKEALKCVVNLLTHDAIKTRRMATAVLASWLRINKPKAVKQEIPIQYVSLFPLYPYSLLTSTMFSPKFIYKVSLSKLYPF